MQSCNSILYIKLEQYHIHRLIWEICDTYNVNSYQTTLLECEKMLLNYYLYNKKQVFIINI